MSAHYKINLQGILYELLYQGKCTLTRPLIIIILCCWQVILYAQQPDTTNTNWQLQVREDMLNLKSVGLKKKEVYSTSRRLEQVFNAPLSATVITRKMLEQTGVVNIAEALRLVPGMLVHQKTNGNYEVNIRHSFSVSSGRVQDLKNQQLLVLIDHMP